MYDFDYDTKIFEAIRHGAHEYTKIYRIVGGSKEKFNSHFSALQDTFRITRIEEKNQRPKFNINQFLRDVDDGVINALNALSKLIENDFQKLLDNKLLKRSVNSVLYLCQIRSLFSFRTQFYHLSKRDKDLNKRMADLCSNLIETVFNVLEKRDKELLWSCQNLVENQLIKEYENQSKKIS